MKNSKALLAISLCAIYLSGCVPIVVGGAAAAVAVVVVNDHRSSPTKKADSDLQKTITDKIQAMSELHDQCHIVVTVFAGNVLLTGQAPTQALKNKAENIAKAVPGSLRLYNEIELAAPNSELNRVSDYWITTKINTLLMRDKSLGTAQIEILTENGTVYVMGTATEAQSATIVKTIKSVSGVEKVVKMLNYTPASVEE